ncbi:ROK family protein [Microbacterium sp.]|uniref:ROK family protein n=1 Tax=Microbacterium sp. TaxID=51671 RepID=UPI00261A38F9|nr:ROK family protein [Microbacterium sp.]
MELCIDLGGTEIKLAIIDSARILGSDTRAVQGDARDLDEAASAAEALIARTQAVPTALGIAVPGVVNPATGRMLHANDKYGFLNEFDLQGWSARNFGLPAVVENDARAALIGETSAGSASGERDAVLLTLGTGIGTAAMIDGIPLRGTTGHAGILGGHVTTDIGARLCPCGNVGCAEALASTWALSHTDSAHGPASVKELFHEDDHTDLRDSFLHVWGATVVTLIHMYDPSVAILSGGILRAGDAVRAPIEAYVRDHLWQSMTAPRFVVPPEPEYSVVRGMSTLARQMHVKPQNRSDQETQ